MILKRLNKQGSSLLWVFVMFIILSIVFTSIGIAYLSSVERLVCLIEKEQVYLTARNVADYFAYKTEKEKEGDVLGIHIIASLDVNGEFTVDTNELLLPEAMGICSVEIKKIDIETVKIVAEAQKKNIKSAFSVYLERQIDIYESETNMLLESNYTGDFSEYDLDTITIKEYWVTFNYEKIN